MVLLERGSEKEEIGGRRNAFVLDGKRMWKEIPKTSIELMLLC